MLLTRDSFSSLILSFLVLVSPSISASVLSVVRQVFQSPIFFVRSGVLPLLVILLVCELRVAGISHSSGLSISYLVWNSLLLFLGQLYFLSLLRIDLSLSILLEVVLDASVISDSLGIRSIFSSGVAISGTFLSVVVNVNSSVLGS